MWDPRLIKAIQSGKIETVIELMDHGADMNEPDSTIQRSALELALVLNKNAVVEAMVNHPAFIFNNLSCIPVTRSVITHRWHLLPILLSKHTDTSIKIDYWGQGGKSLLRMAMEQHDIESHMEAVTLLLDHGCNPNRVHEGNQTPLGFAIESGLANTVSTIIRHRDFKFTLATTLALFSCMVVGNEVLFNELLDKHRDSSIEIDKIISSDSATLLTHAVTKGWETAIDRLIDHGANPGVPLYHAIVLKKEKIARQIIAHKDFKYTVNTGKEQCAFRMAVENGYERVAVELLDCGFTPPPQDKVFFGFYLRHSLTKRFRFLAMTLLKHPGFSATNFSIMDCVREALLSDQFIFVPILLSKSTVRITVIDDTIGYPAGRNALATAVDKHQDDIINLLLDHGADPNKELGNHETPLTIAARDKTQILFKIILGHKNFKFTQGTGRAILECLITEQPSLVTLLLKKHKDMSIPVADCTWGEEKLTAVQIARQKGYEHLVDILLKHGAPDLDNTVQAAEIPVEAPPVGRRVRFAN